MEMPSEVREILHSGYAVAAELPAPRPEMRAFVMVIPRVPSPHKCPEAWDKRTCKPMLRDVSFIHGYEVRYLLHHEKFTDTEWGWDYDYVLDDETTRAHRTFVEQIDDIEAALSAWSVAMADLQDPGPFDSSLVNSPIEYYLDRPTDRPHLWRE